MSTADLINRLITAKNSIATKITSMGGTVTEGDGFEDFSADIGTIPQGSTEHGYKKWTVTLPSEVSSGIVTFVEADPTIIQHCEDDNAIARITWEGDSTTLGTYRVSSASNANTPISTGISGYSLMQTTFYPYSSTLQAASSRSAMLAATSAGNISYRAISSRILPAGTYTVEFWW